MKKRNIVLMVIGILFVSIGVGGYLLAGNYNNTQGQNFGMMNNGIDESQRYGDVFNRTGSMMSRDYWDDATENDDEKFPVDVLTKAVEDYIGEYDNDLIVSDIFVYEDSAYYYAIVEADTGKGAMELLVNPFTKDIFPEYGPNMMWNLKYGGNHNRGMMGYQGSNLRSGMMGGRGMMGNWNTDDYTDSGDYSEDNEITVEEAYNEGTDYLAKRDDGLTLSESAHAFYGYYTFHIEKDGMPTGMLSVNGYTGEVWYHDWHGELIEIIDGHE